MTGTEMAKRVNEYRAHTIASDGRQRHRFGLVSTDGMTYVAETCGAYWLLDLLASYQPRLRNEEFQLWRLEWTPTRRRPEAWTIEAWSDTVGADGAVRLVTQKIPHSDFPKPLSPFEFYVECRTAMLKEER